MSFGQTFFERLMLAFFIIHIPTTILIDAQVVIPHMYFPSFALAMSEGYIRDYGDPLMKYSPLWFKSLVWTEVLLQLPFFFVAAYAFAKRQNWIRIPAIIYGSFVVSTMVPILTELYHHENTASNKVALMGMYIPFLIVPGWLVINMALASKPFPAIKKGKGAFKKVN